MGILSVVVSATLAAPAPRSGTATRTDLRVAAGELEVEPGGFEVPAGAGIVVALENSGLLEHNVEIHTGGGHVESSRSCPTEVKSRALLLDRTMAATR